MLARLVLCGLALAACTPRDPGGSAGEGEPTAAPASTSTGQPSTGTAASTTTTEAAPTTTGPAEPTASSTTEALPACSWYWPEFADLYFCPAPEVLAVPITGMTPAGPRTFRFAMFGLQGCSSCYTAESPAITLYVEEPGDEPYLPETDIVRIEWWKHADPAISAMLDGKLVHMQDVALTLELTSVPSEAETSPPLDEAAPPVLRGSFAVEGEGWDLAGSFDATLCSELRWFIDCE